jgi:DNA segregation ATPase FtsK/SpoIIIE-like protein
VKYSKITGLSDDLSLAMKAESVLIDRIPGKSTVGIQIPNADREQISLREMLESEAYQNAGSKLMMALGKSIHGEPFFADLATMPHLLIAGSTGTGKSVGLNSMLTSILYRATPEDVRLIMIDPSASSSGMYADIPHLLTPVVVGSEARRQRPQVGGRRDGASLQDDGRRSTCGTSSSTTATCGSRSKARRCSTTASRRAPCPSSSW